MECRAGLMAALLLAAGTVRLSSTAAQGAADASVAGARLPVRLECGLRFSASITMLNTGATTWTAAEALAAVGGEDALTEEARVRIPEGVEVAPGESHTFRFTLTAPDIPLASTRTAWRMAGEDGSAFGETAVQDVSVACPPRVDDAELVAADLPLRLTCGQRYRARIVLRNTGHTRWSRRDGYALGPVEGRDGFAAPDGVALPEGTAVAPDSDHAFTMTLTAPAAAGAYRLAWRMARAGAGWFGPSVSQTVKVVCAARSALP